MIAARLYTVTGEESGSFELLGRICVTYRSMQPVAATLKRLYRRITLRSGSGLVSKQVRTGIESQLAFGARFARES